MQLTRTCKITNRTTTQDIPITEGMLKMWQKGAPLQVVAPHLTPDQREFVITGILPDTWNWIFDAEIEDTPADGRRPPLTPEARERQTGRADVDDSGVYEDISLKITEDAKEDK
jgi:hypothetical protein